MQPGLAQSLGLSVMTNEAAFAVELQPERRRLRGIRLGSCCGRTPPNSAARPCVRTGRRSSDRCSRSHSTAASPSGPGAARGTPGRGRPGRRRAHRARRGSGLHPRASGRAPRRRRLRPQRRDARTLRRRPAEPRPGGRSRTRATPARCSPRRCASGRRPICWTRPGGSLAPDGPVRPVHSRPGAPAPAHDLRRRRRPALRERVELVHGSGQGDVRPQQDKPGRPVLAHLRRPVPQALRPPALTARAFPKKLLESGNLKQAWTLDDLARLCDIDPAGLSETVERFNENARNGVDPDYGRGESAYNRALGDPNHRVAPCLGPLDEPPYYAVEVVPGDIGTCGGVLTDEHAPGDRPGRPADRGALRTGNGTATVMGRHYLGPGASIANTMVFGYVAARHATTSRPRRRCVRRGLRSAARPRRRVRH